MKRLSGLTVGEAILVLLELVLFPSVLLANVDWVVSGRVVDKASQAPLEYVTVMLLRSDSSMVGGGVTDSLGYYKVKGIAAGSYIVKYSYVGFAPTERRVTVKGNMQLPIVTLDDGGGNHIGEVVVSAKRPTFTQNLDKKVYMVGNDVTASTGSISDLLQNVPTLDVDIDGNVSLRGNSNVTILINGRPSAQMNSKNRGDILQQLSASQIERIEVVTNPSADLKPDGVSGVVNIITKKNVVPGLNGSVRGNIGSKGRANTGLSLNWQQGRWSFNGNVGYRKDRYDRITDDTRSFDTHTITQRQVGIGHPKSVQVGLGMGVDLSKNDRLEFSGSYDRRHFLRTEDIESADRNLDGNTLSSYYRTRKADAVENAWNGSAHYEHRYGHEGRIDVDYAYMRQVEDESNDYHTQTTVAGGNPVDQQEWQHVNDEQYLHTASLRWQVRPTKDMLLKAGYELEAERRVQGFHLTMPNGNNIVEDPTRSSDFANDRYIHSLYSTLQWTLGKWELMGGARMEYVWMRSRLYTIDSTAYQHYFNFYPTLHAAWHVTPHHSLALSYSLRVHRPDGDWLNPFAESINPLSLRSGNTELTPEKTHSLELGWQWNNGYGTNIMATLYGRHTMNEIVWTSHDIGDGVILTRPENAKSHDAAGLEMVWSQPIGKWLNFNWDLNGFYTQISATTQGSGSRHNSWSWTTKLNTNITPFRNLTLQLNTRYRSPRALSQGRRHADFRMDAGLKYEIPRWRLAFVGSVTDLFDTYRRTQTLDADGMHQTVKARRNPRIAYIGMVWNFGMKMKKSEEIKYDEGL